MSYSPHHDQISFTSHYLSLMTCLPCWPRPPNQANHLTKWTEVHKVRDITVLDTYSHMYIISSRLDFKIKMAPNLDYLVFSGTPAYPTPNLLGSTMISSSFLKLVLTAPDVVLKNEGVCFVDQCLISQRVWHYSEPSGRFCISSHLLGSTCPWCSFLYQMLSKTI